MAASIHFELINNYDDKIFRLFLLQGMSNHIYAYGMPSTRHYRDETELRIRMKLGLVELALQAVPDVPAGTIAHAFQVGRLPMRLSVPLTPLCPHCSWQLLIKLALHFGEGIIFLSLPGPASRAFILCCFFPNPR